MTTNPEGVNPHFSEQRPGLFQNRQQASDVVYELIDYLDRGSDDPMFPVITFSFLGRDNTLQMLPIRMVDIKDGCKVDDFIQENLLPHIDEAVSSYVSMGKDILSEAIYYPSICIIDEQLASVFLEDKEHMTFVPDFGSILIAPTRMQHFIETAQSPEIFQFAQEKFFTAFQTLYFEMLWRVNRIQGYSDEFTWHFGEKTVYSDQQFPTFDPTALDERIDTYETDGPSGHIFTKTSVRPPSEVVPTNEVAAETINTFVSIDQTVEPIVEWLQSRSAMEDSTNHFLWQIFRNNLHLIGEADLDEYSMSAPLSMDCQLGLKGYPKYINSGEFMLIINPKRKTVFPLFGEDPKKVRPSKGLLYDCLGYIELFYPKSSEIIRTVVFSPTSLIEAVENIQGPEKEIFQTLFEALNFDDEETGRQRLLALRQQLRDQFRLSVNKE